MVWRRYQVIGFPSFINLIIYVRQDSETTKVRFSELSPCTLFMAHNMSYLQMHTPPQVATLAEYTKSDPNLSMFIINVGHLSKSLGRGRGLYNQKTPRILTVKKRLRTFQTLRGHWEEEYLKYPNPDGTFKTECRLFYLSWAHPNLKGLKFDGYA
jgi:hypothetical protein